MVEREPGPYWVRSAGKHRIDEWQIASWLSGGYWLVLGNDEAMSDEDFAEIGERVERPEPQPITDAQKSGERFLVWDADDKDWVIASWREPDSPSGPKCWCGDSAGPNYENTYDSATHYFPLPTDVKP
jgi:hypothetical protein